MDTALFDFLNEKRQEMAEFLLKYKFVILEIETKMKILNEELKTSSEYNPIENVSTRLKSPESLINKVLKKGYDFDLKIIEKNIHDIAGIRITCSFISDIYKVYEMIKKQSDIEIVNVKDYIHNPKSNGYQSLHLIVKVPVFFSDGKEMVYAEIQIRTVAMDFWASLEHKIFYKYNGEVPQHIKDELLTTALQSSELDRRMEKLNIEVNAIKGRAALHSNVISDEQWKKVQTLFKNVGLSKAN